MQHSKLVGVGKLFLTLSLLILIPVWIGFSQDPLIRYQANFSTANSMVWSTSNSSQAKRWINSGQYHIVIESLDYETWVVANGPEFSSFRLDIDTAVTACPADNAYGVLFRCAGENSFYAFIISADGYIKLLKRLNGNWETIVPPKRCYTVHLGQTSNHLTVVADGCRLIGYVNGGKVLDVTDYSLECGRIGLIAAVNLYPGFQIAFDNVTLRALPSN